jgi:putative membrane protein
MRRARVAIVAAAVVLGASLAVAMLPARAQSNTTPGDNAVLFAREAALGNMAEVRLGKVAQANAASDQVKQFAARMIADHSKADEQLRAVTTKKQIALPTDLDGVHRALLDKLSALKATAFDIAYMDAMLDDHTKTVAMFRQEADRGNDAELKAYAASALPTLEAHLKMAKQIDDSVKAPGPKN